MPIRLQHRGVPYLHGREDGENTHIVLIQLELYYPNTTWLCLPAKVFEQLSQYKARHGIHIWEEAFEPLLGVTAGVKS